MKPLALALFALLLAGCASGYTATAPAPIKESERLGPVACRARGGHTVVYPDGRMACVGVSLI